MAVYLHHIETMVPDHVYEQSRIGAVIAAQHPNDPRWQRYLRQLYRNSAIDTRHSVIPDLAPEASSEVFFDAGSGRFKSPTTAERNALYAREATKLFGCLARRTAARAQEIGAGDVTHVITASCTGFFAPGPDAVVAKALGRPELARFHLGFMGCYAAIPALRLAASICQADRSAVVLVVCVELCTLHLTVDRTPDNAVASALFADGGAAALLCSQSVSGTGKRAKTERPLKVASFASTLTGGGESDMTWMIGDHGFEMTLSSYVPDIVEDSVQAAVAPLFEALQATPQQIEHWAIHPGGKAIIDRVAKGLDLPPNSTLPSRSVLKKFGNMSSPSVLFVLRDVMTGTIKPGERVAMLAFGPGLTVESGLFEAV